MPGAARRNGGSVPGWTEFPLPHFHDTSHEVLCVAAASGASLRRHEGKTVEVSAGDSVVIPVGGALYKGSGRRFRGRSLNPGEENTMRTGSERRPEVLENIRNAALPESDPLFGEEGPLLQLWTR